ncbi:MAG: aminotransferase class III [Desulfobacterales bacterium PC51MH44]|nr:MAG: aminotransferase class III [Desulfobacterales bacterium PC51MH44]
MIGFSLKLEKSLRLQREAKKRIPGMTQLLSKRPDRFSDGVWPGYYKKAKGVEVWDLDGNRYTDMSIGGIGANVLGYADPDVDQAVIQAIQRGSSCSLNCPEEVELAELLCELHPWAEMVRYARTGGEAMAIAVRIARAHTGKDKIAFCGYHGWHDWYLAANLGKNDALNGHLQAGLLPNGVPKGLQGTALPFRYNDLDALKGIVKENKNELAAVVMEPIRNFEPEPGFLTGIAALAKENNIVLILDEISAGLRMNTGGAHLLLGVTPDVAVFSKAIGNGYPMAAVIGKAEVMQAAQRTFISSTNWTERIGPTAALATIKKHRRLNVGEHLVALGKKVQKGWKILARKQGFDLDIGGIPPLSHFSFKVENAPATRALFVQLMLEQGFLATNSFYSMYAHTIWHVDAYLEAVDSAFASIVEAMSRGEVKDRLIGQPAMAGFRRLA